MLISLRGGGEEPVSWLDCLTPAESGSVMHWGWERNSPAGNWTPIVSFL